MEGMLLVSQNQIKSTKRNQDNVQLPLSKRHKQIINSGKRISLSIDKNQISGEYFLDHNQIFYAHPAMDKKIQQPSFIFNTIGKIVFFNIYM